MTNDRAKRALDKAREVGLIAPNGWADRWRPFDEQAALEAMQQVLDAGRSGEPEKTGTTLDLLALGATVAEAAHVLDREIDEALEQQVVRIVVQYLRCVPAAGSVEPESPMRSELGRLFIDGDQWHQGGPAYRLVNLLEALEVVPDTGDWHAEVKSLFRRLLNATPNHDRYSPNRSATEQRVALTLTPADDVQGEYICPKHGPRPGPNAAGRCGQPLVPARMGYCQERLTRCLTPEPSAHSTP